MRNYGGGWIHTFGPRLILDVRAGYYRQCERRADHGTGARHLATAVAIRDEAQLLTPLDASAVTPEVDVKAGAEEETFALADFDQFETTASDRLRVCAFGHQEHTAPVCI